jgi:hypothetical protein
VGALRPEAAALLDAIQSKPATRAGNAVFARGSKPIAEVYTAARAVEWLIRWRWQRVEDNWKQQVTLWIKTRVGERIPLSQILIRNLEEGNNEKAITGTKPRKLIINEIFFNFCYYCDTIMCVQYAYL